jgi:hypothetical protein
MTQNAWLKNHWATLAQWCECEFIIRTIAVKTDNAPADWVPIATRLTILEVYNKALELGSPLNPGQLIARYRRRNWLQWMRRMDEQTEMDLRQQLARRAKLPLSTPERGSTVAPSRSGHGHVRCAPPAR